MNLNQALQTASRLAYDEDADHVVTLHGQEWRVSHFEDLGGQISADLEFRVYGDGPDAAEMMTVLSAAEESVVTADQDWENETTTWTLPTGERIAISGQDVIVRPAAD